MPEPAVGVGFLYGLCAVAYLALALLILVQAARRGRIRATAVLLAAAGTATAAWASAALWQTGAVLDGWAGRLDVLRGLVWYGFVLWLLHSADTGDPAPRRDRLTLVFAAIGVCCLVATATVLAFGRAAPGTPPSLGDPGLAVRLMLALCQLLLLENLYRNTEPGARWNVALACFALGGLAAFDVVIWVDAALAQRMPRALLDARPMVAVLACPLLALAAARNRAWSVDIHVSRGAVFHTATLVAVGGFLLAVGLAAELAQRLVAGSHWGRLLQASLWFAAALTLAVLLTSGTARSLLRLALVDPFFTRRYDYQHEWVRCIDTLSDQAESQGLHRRAVRAVAQVVDSPAGMLLLREPDALGLHWADSWNLPQLPAPLPPDHPLLTALAADAAAIRIAATRACATAPLDAVRDLWLAVPLRHGGRLAGCVLVARPRAPFRLDREVFELLGIVAHEVATRLAEQRAARVVLETRDLRAYGERFAFVAHDIKNVSSQLSLLLSNAETHLANPEFQRDMLRTIDASVQKIAALLRRLETAPAAGPAEDGPARRLVPAERLAMLARQALQLRGAAVVLDDGGCTGAVALDPSVFDTVVTHLLDNAIEAAGADRPVHIRVREEAGRALIDIVDRGPGMTPEFVRDHLFRPFRTSKRQGSGIGAFQARALLRAAAGDLLVDSRPGTGTTMRLLLPLARSEIMPLSA